MTVLILLTLTTLPPALAPAAQAVERVKIGANVTTSKLGVDWTGKSEDDTAHAFAIVKCHLRWTNPLLPASNKTVQVDVLVEQPGTVLLPWKDVLEGVPSGDWDLQARWEDEVGQLGNWSDVTPKTMFQVEASNPSKPENVGAVAN